HELELLVGDTVAFGLQQRVAARAAAERIDPRGKVAVAADRLGEADGADGDPDVEAGRQRRPRKRRTGDRRGPGRSPGLEQLTCPLVDRLGIGYVAVVQLEQIPLVDALKIPEIQ